MKGIGIIRKLNETLPRHSLIIICKSFVRSRLDYGYIIYNQTNNKSRKQKIERIQYNAALAITGIIKATSQSRLCNELGLDFLNLGVGLGNCVPFIKLKQQVYHNTCLIFFHKPII